MVFIYIDNFKEWIDVVAQLHQRGYKWTPNKFLSTRYSCAKTEYEFVQEYNDLEYPQFPALIVVEFNSLYWCKLDYMKEKFPKYYDKMIRKLKIKKLNNIK